MGSGMDAAKSAPELDPPKRPPSETMPLNEQHPGGRVRHGGFVQIIRMLLFVDYLVSCCCVIHAAQILGSPLYLLHRDYYYAYMAWTKLCFGILITTLCQWWSPTIIRVSGDESVRGQLRQADDGRLHCAFPERLVLIANHQLYTDWLYLWWIAYTNRMHGHLYIILKESLKYIPILGPGMMFYEFIFLSRNWKRDRPRLARHMSKLKSRHSGPLSGSTPLDPMWLLIFPEGTNLSDNGRKNSAAWAEKQGMPDLQHQLHPRSTGSLYCLQELKDTVSWVYDCTLAYEGIPRDKYGQDIFTLRSSFIQGRPPKSVNMYWRRFAMSSIPLDDANAFDRWIRERWIEKDHLMEHYMQTGRFPADDERAGTPATGEKAETKTPDYIETEVRQGHWWEIGQLYVVLGAFGLVAYALAQAWNVALHGRSAGFA
ncbi:MAG: NADH kinase pos5 [Watsoniomyces obsoletus]|nr:MAG: NADH kinase pos5 [Watsoniomyces obsoletus]